jgi:membrane associated rhomboid family serine protease
MLDDRSYMREPEYRGGMSWVTIILITNAVAFVVHSMLEYFWKFPVSHYLALSLDGLRHGYIWQFLTFQFMHGGVMHLLCNSIAIYFFGRAIEEDLGKVGFLKLYLTSGFAGGFLQMLGALALPSHFGGAVLGASAGAFGLVAAFATLYPERPLTLLLFFVIPVEMRAKFLLIISALLAIFGMVIPNDNIAHAAHLGGMIIGIAYIRYVMRWDEAFRIWRQNRSSPRPLKVVTPKLNVGYASATNISNPPLRSATVNEEFISKEVDPILDKISAHGIHSLTDQERKILEAARNRMAKR